MSDVWVVIPAYNEEKEISKVVKKIRKYTPNMVVVDDGSCDKTYEIAQKNNVVVLKHIINLGKGAALKTGCDYAVSKGAQKIVVLDADAQHDPDEIPHFVKALDRKEMVFGFRRLNKHMPFLLKFGNWGINLVIRLLYGVSIKDTQSGYRAFRAKTYKKIRWNAQDYSMESEMIANVGKYNVKYTQIPIKTIYSDRYKGTTIVDGFKIVFKLIKWKFLG